ncbi:MAG: hypothetical protein JWP17_1430 [Solirubrobacterales bacterium]|nr:hypothetical protein [Solirubrobacterales bacterium]
MTAGADLLADYERAAGAAAALRALDALAAADVPVPFELALEYDEMAAELADDGEFVLAARAQRRALELGYDGDPDGRELLAWYLLRTGERDEPRRLLDELRAERGPGDVSTDLLASNAYLDSGLIEEGLAALDHAVATARAVDSEDLAEALVQRMEARHEFGRQEDDDDRLAATLVVAPGPVPQPTLPWFAPDQAERAAAQWPEVAEELADNAAYNRQIDQDAREVTEAVGRRPAIVSVVVADYLRWATDAGRAGDQFAALEAYADERHRAGDSFAWPPGRNEPCWCGSERKYKKCCGGS